jgi:2-polyprenyl-6-methoxyphenol hydroxylase-like FAD-dependent oxidoreductase
VDRLSRGCGGPDGREERCEAAYIAGCNGASSIVRETIGTGVPGGTYHHLFYVADIEASGPAIEGEMHIDLEEADFLAMFPLAEKGRARLVGTVQAIKPTHLNSGMSVARICHVGPDFVRKLRMIRNPRCAARFRQVLRDRQYQSRIDDPPRFR